MPSKYLDKIRAKQGLTPKTATAKDSVKEPEEQAIPPVPHKVRKCCGTRAGDQHLHQPGCHHAQKKKSKRTVYMSGRLPDDSEFRVIYDAERKMWSGDLYTPATGTLSDECSSVFKLLQKLDRQYRNTINAKKVQKNAERTEDQKDGSAGMPALPE